jgi:hypothetical protein
VLSRYDFAFKPRKFLLSTGPQVRSYVRPGVTLQPWFGCRKMKPKLSVSIKPEVYQVFFSDHYRFLTDKAISLPTVVSVRANAYRLSYR